MLHVFGNCFITFLRVVLLSFSCLLMVAEIYLDFVAKQKAHMIGNLANLTASLSSIQFSSVTQSCSTLCDPMNHSAPGLPVHHQLLEFTQTHAHRVGDAIQPSHPLSSPSPPALNPSQHQGLFQ